MWVLIVVLVLGVVAFAVTAKDIGRYRRMRRM
jgi:hypothetical protein